MLGEEGFHLLAKGFVGIHRMRLDLGRHGSLLVLIRNVSRRLDR